MNNNLLLILLLFISFNSISQGIVPSLGATYGTEIKTVGANLRAYYFFNHHICLGPEISYFPKHNLHHKDVSLLELNITGHYVFEITEQLGFYPLTGINYSIEKETAHNETLSHNALGINLGAGLHYKLNNILPFIEYKYITGDLSQNVYSAGILIMLEKKTKKTNH